jgi:hypothetical protein
LGLMRMESKNFDESIGMTSLTTQSLRLQVLTLQIALVRQSAIDDRRQLVRICRHDHQEHYHK